MLKLLAKDYEDFKRWTDSWANNGFLLYQDYSHGVYESMALIHGQVVAMQYQEEKEEEEETSASDSSA